MKTGEGRDLRGDAGGKRTRGMRGFDISKEVFDSDFFGFFGFDRRRDVGKGSLRGRAVLKSRSGSVQLGRSVQDTLERRNTDHCTDRCPELSSTHISNLLNSKVRICWYSHITPPARRSHIHDDHDL